MHGSCVPCLMQQATRFLQKDSHVSHMCFHLHWAPRIMIISFSFEAQRLCRAFHCKRWHARAANRLCVPILRLRLYQLHFQAQPGFDGARQGCTPAARIRGAGIQHASFVRPWRFQGVNFWTRTPGAKLQTKRHIIQSIVESVQFPIWSFLSVLKLRHVTNIECLKCGGRWGSNFVSLAVLWAKRLQWSRVEVALFATRILRQTTRKMHFRSGDDQHPPSPSLGGQGNYQIVQPMFEEGMFKKQ